jgi:hypothetical protein
MLLLSLDKTVVLGALKSTVSKDPDVLRAKLGELTEQTKGLRLWSWVPVISGALLTITIIGAIIGVPILLLGIWLRRKTARNLKMADDTMNEYMQSLGISSAMAA